MSDGVLPDTTVNKVQYHQASSPYTSSLRPRTGLLADGALHSLYAKSTPRFPPWAAGLGRGPASAKWSKLIASKVKPSGVPKHYRVIAYSQTIPLAPFYRHRTISWSDEASGVQQRPFWAGNVQELAMYRSQASTCWRCRFCMSRSTPPTLSNSTVVTTHAYTPPASSLPLQRRLESRALENLFFCGSRPKEATRRLMSGRLVSSNVGLSSWFITKATLTCKKVAFHAHDVTATTRPVLRAYQW